MITPDSPDSIDWSRFPRHEELTARLHDCERRYPHLVRVRSIGRSYEGRGVWLATVTCFATGEDRDKPALWVDGNIHATELAASSACLYLIHTLLAGYGMHADITRCLDTRAFYICPRVNPDGAEWALAERPRVIRSSTRPYPYDEEPLGGLIIEDIDGDGRMLMMRMPDPNGPWKVCAQEPRLLVRREPAEIGGQYYRLLPEGRLEDYDGATIRLQSKKERLDLNRNFPDGWRPEGEQEGAGPYPTSEPEVRNTVDFIASHPNITGGVAFHTWSGVLLRPYGQQSDEAFAAEDLWTYQAIGRKGTEITGYPAISSYHEFRYHPKQTISGVFDDWMYESRGAFAWTVEIWSPQREAGITEYKYIDWYREHPLEDDIKLLRWSDQALGGKGYADWYPFEHPQLGRIELGGWDALHAFRNPPPQYREREIAKFPDWLVWHLLISPRLELLEASASPLGDGTYKIRLVAQNTGWLPSYVTKKAVEKKLTRGVVCEIELPQGASLETGEARLELGELEGRSYKPSAPNGWTDWSTDPTTDRVKAEWVIRAAAGATVRLVARHERAGVVRTALVLPSAEQQGQVQQ